MVNVINLFELYATIGLKDDGFESGINSAKKSTTGLLSGVNNLISTVAGIKLVSAAFTAVKDSIGGAVERYDTLNRFPLMLQQMGFEAEDASVATQKLSGGIQGLPTRLDDVVSTAQRLTVLTGNLEKSTNTTLALNNAFLASGSSSADASRGLTQYVQMLSKGEVDMQSWRTLQETMGYALNETAKAFGYAGESAQNDLYAALKTGFITFDEFNGKIIELSNQTGGFAELAKTASVGIGTSWTNMQTAITRGTTAIIGSIDTGLAQSSLPNLQQSIEMTGSSFESFLKIMAEVTGDTIKALAPAIKTIGSAFKSASPAVDILKKSFNAVLPIVNVAAKNIELLTKTTIAATIAFKAVQAVQTWQNAIKSATVAINAHKAATILMSTVTVENTAVEILSQKIKDKSAASEAIRTVAKKAGIIVDKEGIVVTAAGTVVTEAEAAAVLASSGAISAKTIIVGVLSGQISIATAAQMLWNAAMAANPIGLVVASVAALAAGIAVLVLSTKSGIESLDDLNKASKDASKSLDEINSTYTNSVSDAKASAIAASNLVGELRNLETQGLKTTSQQKRYSNIVNQINDLMPDLNATIDENTGLIKGGTDALKDNIEALKDQYIQQAYIKKSSDLYEEQAQMIVMVNDAEFDLYNTQNKKTELLKELSDITGLTTDELEKYTNNLNLTGVELASVLSLGDSWNSQIENIGNNIYDLTLEEGMFNQAIQNGNKAVSEFDSQINENNASLGFYEQKLDEVEVATESVTTTTVNSFTSIADAYKDFSDVQKAAVDAVLSAYETMTGSLSSLTEKIELDSETTWASVVKNQDNVIEKTKEFSDLYGQLIDAGISESYLNAIGATGPESIPLLKGMLNAGIDEVKSSQTEWEDAYGVIGNSLIESLELDADTKSALKEYILGESGVFGTLDSAVKDADFESLSLGLMTSIQGGIVKGIPGTTDTMGVAAQDIITAWRTNMDQHSPSQVFVDLGSGLMDGLDLGVKNTSPKVINTFNDLIRLIISVMEEGGKNVIKGFVKGIESGLPDVKKAANKIVDSTVKTTEDGFKINSPSVVFNNIGKYIIDGLIKGLLSKSVEAVKTMRNIGSNVIADFKELFGIHSPSTVFEQLGVFTVDGFIIGLESMAESVQNVLGKTFDIGNVISEIKSRLSSYVELATDMFSRIDTESELSTDEMIENLIHNQEAIANWATNIAELANRGVNEGLLNTLREAGPESAGTVAELVNASDEQLSRLSEVFGRGGDVATGALVTSLGLATPSMAQSGTQLANSVAQGMKDSTSVDNAMALLISSAKDAGLISIQSADFKGMGKAMPDGIVVGVEGGKADAVNAITDVATGMSEKMIELNKIGSPSKLYEEHGMYLMQGLRDGVVKNYQIVISALVELTRRAKESMTIFKNEIMAIANSITLYPAGQNIINSFWSGMESKKDSLYENVKKLFEGVASQAEKALEISSPSKVMIAMGGYTVDGYIIGLKNMANTLYKTMDDIFSPDISAIQLNDNVSGRNGVALAGAGISAGVASPININQYIQSVPQTANEQAVTMAASFQMARWNLKK